MFLAKFKSGATVKAAEYRRFVHVQDIECGDADCHARVTFRQGSGENGVINTHGHSVQRAPHFATLPAEKHREGCTNKSLISDPDAKPGSTFYEAAATPGIKLLINLNMDLGSGLSIHFRNASQMSSTRTEYGQFMRDNRPSKDNDSVTGKKRPGYVAAGVTDFAELLDLIEKIRDKGGQDAIDRSYVSHALSIRPLNAIMVERNAGKLKQLYSRMLGGNDHIAALPDRIVGFPVIVQFTPTRNSRQTDTPIYGNSCVVHQSDDLQRKLILLSEIHAESPQVAGWLEEQGREAVILACPVIPSIDDRIETGLYNRGARQEGHNGKEIKVDKGAWFLHMNWTLASPAQVAPVPADLRKYAIPAISTIAPAPAPAPRPPVSTAAQIPLPF